MNQKQQISQRQLAWLIGTIMVTEGLINLPRQSVTLAGIDALFCYLIPILYSFLIAYFIYRMMRLFPGKNLYQIVMEIAGKGAGTIINVILLLYFWLILMRDVRSLSLFSKSMLLPRTPEEILILAFMLVVMYYAKTSLEVTARVNDLFLPFLLALIVMLPILLSNEMDIRQSDPLLTKGPVSITVSNLLNIGWYADLLVVGAFLPIISGARAFFTSVRHGIALSTFLLTWLVLISIYVISPSIASRSLFPIYTLVQQIHITEFIDRLEIFVFSFWGPIMLIKVIMIFMAILVGINVYAGTTNHRVFYRSLAWIIILTTMLSFRNFTEIYNFGNFSLPAIALIALTPIFILMELLTRRRKFAHLRQAAAEVDRQDDVSSQGQKQEKEESNQPRRENDQQPKSNSLSYNRMVRVPYRVWMKRTHYLLALCVLSVAIGAWFGKSLPLLGPIAGILYVIGLLLAVGSSFMEMRRTNRPT